MEAVEEVEVPEVKTAPLEVAPVVVLVSAKPEHSRLHPCEHHSLARVFTTGVSGIADEAFSPLGGDLTGYVRSITIEKTVDFKQPYLKVSISKGMLTHPTPGDDFEAFVITGVTASCVRFDRVPVGVTLTVDALVGDGQTEQTICTAPPVFLEGSRYVPGALLSIGPFVHDSFRMSVVRASYPHYQNLGSLALYNEIVSFPNQKKEKDLTLKKGDEFTSPIAHFLAHRLSEAERTDGRIQSLLKAVDDNATSVSRDGLENVPAAIKHFIHSQRPVHKDGVVFQDQAFSVIIQHHGYENDHETHPLAQVIIRVTAIMIPKHGFRSRQ